MTTVFFWSTLVACNLLGGGESVDPAAAAVAAADAQLRGGDIAGAADAYVAALAAYPGNLEAAIGAAFGAYNRGEFAEADQILAGAEATAGDRAGELRLRRALIAMKDGDTDLMREHAEASNTAAGLVLAAEVALADGEREEARALLDRAAQVSGPIGTVANDYVDLLKHEDPAVAGLAENYALWALGQREVAVASVEEVVKGLPDDYEGKAEELLVWAGRSASFGESQVASNLLEAIDFPPQGQAWRVLATRAIILCAEGQAEDCSTMLDSLEGKAPGDGLQHARATAAIALGGEDRDAAVAVLGSTASDAAARAALVLGDPGLAGSLATDAVMKNYISGM
jgi:tetratricopeptide (TPR) repeat protein